MHIFTNEQMIERYEKYLKQKKKLNEKTIRNYIYDLKTYNNFLNDVRFFDTTEKNIKEYIQNKINKNNSDNRIMFSMSTLSSFYKYLVRSRYMANNPMINLSRPKSKKTEMIYLNRTELSKVKKKLREHGNIQLEAFWAIMNCLPKKYMIAKIEWRKINWKKKYIEVEINEKERCILYIDDYCVEKLSALRKLRKDKGIKKKYVFLTRHNKSYTPVSDDGISSWLRKIKNIAQLENLSFAIMKNSSIRHLKTTRRFSEEKVDKMIEHGKKWSIEFRQSILEEVEKVLRMK